jgi:predicted ATPase
MGIFALFSGLNIAGKLITIAAIIAAFSGYSGVLYYKGYSAGEYKATKEVRENYIKIINKTQEENSKRIQEETSKYLNEIENNIELKNTIKEKEIELKKWKSKAMQNKECKMEKQDVDNFNDFLKVLKAKK